MNISLGILTHIKFAKKAIGILCEHFLGYTCTCFVNISLGTHALGAF